MPQRAVRRESQRYRSTAPKDRAKVATGWDEAVRAFLAEGRRQNLSPSTIENYRWYLAGQRVQQFRSDHGIDSPADLTVDSLKAFERDLVDAGLSPGTVNTFHGTLKNFAGFAIREGYGISPEVLDVKGPRLPKVEPDTFTFDETKQILEAVADRPRDEMIIRLMLQTGLRLQEVCKVTLDDIVETPQGAYVRVRQGKGRKDRAVPLDTPKEKLTTRLDKYIRKVRPTDTKQQALFLTSRKEGDDYQPISAHGIQTMCKRLGLVTGVHINPHKFRHTFATRSLGAGVDVMALQKALGHTTLAMVSRYVHYQKDDLLQAWRERRD